MSVVPFNFTASVTSSDDPVILVGDSVQGSVSYDSTQVGSAGLYTFTGSSKTHTFSFKDYRGGVEITSDAYAGHPASLYQIIMSIVNNVTQMEVKGVTLAPSQAWFIIRLAQFLKKSSKTPRVSGIM